MGVARSRLVMGSCGFLLHDKCSFKRGRELEYKALFAARSKIAAMPLTG